MIFFKKILSVTAPKGFIAVIVAIFSMMTLAAVLAPAAFAVDRPINISPSRVDNIPSNKNADDLLSKVLAAVYAIAGTIAIIAIIYGGLMYITSDGDSSKTSNAKSTIIYAAIGLVIVGLAFIITGVVQNIANS